MNSVKAMHELACIYIMWYHHGINLSMTNAIICTQKQLKKTTSAILSHQWHEVSKMTHILFILNFHNILLLLSIFANILHCDARNATVNFLH